MNRREFVSIFGGAAALWPLATRAQQPAMPVVGFLRSTSFVAEAHFVTAFRQGLSDMGFVEGRNVAIEFRWADNQVDRLPDLVADLLRRQVAVIVANSPAARVAKAATATVPIVFTSGSDPAKDGLVVSLNRPGGNVTGAVFFGGLLVGKRLELLRQVVPNATMIGMLAGPNSPETEAERTELPAAAQAIGRQLLVLDVGSDRDIDQAFATFVERGAGGLLVGSGATLFSHRERIVALAARHALPAIYTLRDQVAAGGSGSRPTRAEPEPIEAGAVDADPERLN
jgi:putative tryptophan/tyrosine transport system substrate-binding protein